MCEVRPPVSVTKAFAAKRASATVSAGGEIVGDDDRLVGEVAEQLDLRSDQVPEQAIADDVDVAATLAEVVLIETVEDHLDLLHRLLERPLRVLAVVHDAIARRRAQRFIAEDQRVRLEQHLHFTEVRLQRARAQILKLLLREDDRVLQPLQLVRAPLDGDVIVRHRHAPPIDDVHLAERDPRADSEPSEALRERSGRHHGSSSARFLPPSSFTPSSNPPAKRLRICSIAPCAFAPVTTTSSIVP